MRKSFVAGNWKMNGVGEDAASLAAELRREIEAVSAEDGADVAICPPFTALHSVGAALAGSRIALGAQDLFWRDNGAYTGRVSGPMLQALGATYVILGHSECRGRFGKAEEDITDETIRHFGDTNASIRLKVHAALRNGLRPIVCCGETLQRAGSTDQIVDVQIHAALHGLTSDDLERVTIAYEPVWAIGTGQTCQPEEADRVCGVIREVIARLAGRSCAEAIRIQYGGSVTADNAEVLLNKEHIDGALVGGQSLKPAAFAKIVAAGRK